MLESANVDTDEISKFDGAAHQWWNTDGPFKPLHDINPVRAALLSDYTNFVDTSFLDIGCGGGLFTEEIAKRGGTVTGIDMSAVAINVAQQHAQQQGLDVTYQQCAVESLPRKKFDVISCLEVLEHVPDPADIIAHIAALLEPNGVMMLSTINRTARAFALAIVGAEYIMKLLPKGTHTYDKLLRPSEIVAMCQRQGLSVEAIEGLQYNPLTRHAKLSRNCAVNYFLIAKKSDEQRQ